MEDVISFITPSFNNEKSIGKCIKSISKQRCQKEIIVVDGGSTDKTIAIAKRYNVKLLIEKKRGSAAARNSGSWVARGNYVAFVDADAILTENWIERALKTIKEADRNVAGVAGPVFAVRKNAIGRALDALSFGMPGKGNIYYTKGLNTTGVLFKMDIFKKIQIR